MALSGHSEEPIVAEAQADMVFLQRKLTRMAGGNYRRSFDISHDEVPLFEDHL